MSNVVLFTWDGHDSTSSEFKNAIKLFCNYIKEDFSIDCSYVVKALKADGLKDWVIVYSPQMPIEYLERILDLVSSNSKGIVFRKPTIVSLETCIKVLKYRLTYDFEWTNSHNGSLKNLIDLATRQK